MIIRILIVILKLLPYVSDTALTINRRPQFKLSQLNSIRVSFTVSYFPTFYQIPYPLLPFTYYSRLLHTHLVQLHETFHLLLPSMSANDILDVLNIQRDESAQPAKKKQKVDQPALQKGAMARELFNLLGPNTPPVNMNMGISRIKDRKQKVSPWTRIAFQPNKKNANAPTFYHWKKGSRELLDKVSDQPYFFDKFAVSLDIPEFVDEPTFDNLMVEIKEHEKEVQKERKRRVKERRENAKKEEERKKAEEDAKQKKNPVKKEELSVVKSAEKGDDKDRNKSDSESKEEENSKDPKDSKDEDDDDASELGLPEWTYEETKLLFELCRDYELKWHVVADRFPADYERSMEDLKEQFYRMCSKILKYKDTGNPMLVESLDAFSKFAENDRKKFLESLLKRTPAEIAEEESLVIEARRFELAAKKMLMERSHLLTLLDSPQSSQSVLQYLSSQGLTNLYNNLMILDKNQRKKLQQRAAGANDPVPPPIPQVASSSHKRDRGFQTHLQQYLSGIVKNQQDKGEPTAVQRLLAKRLTTKEEEAYGLHYHVNERLTPGVILRSTQKLPGLQQRQSVFKSVNAMLQELDIPTAGGTTWKPVMPTRKTMAKYDELIRAVVALLDVKRGKDKLDAEIELIKAQRGLQ